MFSWVTHFDAWIGLIALSVLQVVLGVDNIVLITILSRTLPKEKRQKARSLGIYVAMVSRLLLLGSIFWLEKLQKPLFTAFDQPVSIKSIILAAGGLFLIAKATKEMFDDMEARHTQSKKGKLTTLTMVLVQIFFLDIIFSIDQVLTAVGMSPFVVIQVLSVLISVFVMAVFVHQVARVLEKHPSLRMIALSFLVLVGVSLLAEGTGHPFPHGYLYFGMTYALVVEVLNIRRRMKAQALAPATNPTPAPVPIEPKNPPSSP